MRTMVKVARYHLVQPCHTWWCRGGLAFGFVLNVVVYAIAPAGHHRW